MDLNIKVNLKMMNLKELVKEYIMMVLPMKEVF